MSSRLQLDVRNLSLGMRHLENAYEVKAGTVYFAGNCVIRTWAPWVWGTTIKALYKSMSFTSFAFTILPANNRYWFMPLLNRYHITDNVYSNELAVSSVTNTEHLYDRNYHTQAFARRFWTEYCNFSRIIFCHNKVVRLSVAGHLTSRDSNHVCSRPNVD